MIKIKDGVLWDESGSAQSEAALEWLRESVFTQMAQSAGESEKIQPEYDRYGRPRRWVIEADGCEVTVTREYVSPESPSWAMRRDTVSVTTKNV